MIIAVDFDGTLINSNGEPNMVLIRSLKAQQQKGNTVILWSCREGKALHEAISFLHRNGFAPNYVNQNSPDIIKQTGKNPRKIIADAYIDDKAINLGQSLEGRSRKAL